MQRVFHEIKDANWSIVFPGDVIICPGTHMWRYQDALIDGLTINTRTIIVQKNPLLVISRLPQTSLDETHMTSELIRVNDNCATFIVLSPRVGLLVHTAWVGGAYRG